MSHADKQNPKDLLGIKKAPLGLVPAALTIIAAPAFADGAKKYGPYNWRENNVKMSVYLEALERHLLAYRDRQDEAEDSGHNHLAHMAACIGIIADGLYGGFIIDDRPPAGPAADMLRLQDKTQQASS